MYLRPLTTFCSIVQPTISPATCSSLVCLPVNAHPILRSSAVMSPKYPEASALRSLPSQRASSRPSTKFARSRPAHFLYLRTCTSSFCRCSLLLLVQLSVVVRCCKIADGGARFQHQIASVDVGRRVNNLYSNVSPIGPHSAIPISLLLSWTPAAYSAP